MLTRTCSPRQHYLGTGETRALGRRSGHRCQHGIVEVHSNDAEIKEVAARSDGSRRWPVTGRHT
jgi:hypothetical protein